MKNKLWMVALVLAAGCSMNDDMGSGDMDGMDMGGGSGSDAVADTAPDAKASDTGADAKAGDTGADAKAGDTGADAQGGDAMAMDGDGMSGDMATKDMGMTGMDM